MTANTGLNHLTVPANITAQHTHHAGLQASLSCEGIGPLGRRNSLDLSEKEVVTLAGATLTQCGQKHLVTLPVCQHPHQSQPSLPISHDLMNKHAYVMQEHNASAHYNPYTVQATAAVTAASLQQQRLQQLAKYVNIPATCRCCCRLTCSNSAAGAIAPAAGLLHPHSTVSTSPTMLAALAQLPASTPGNLTMPAGLLLQCVG